MAIELEPSWLKVLGDEFEKPYMVNLKDLFKKRKRFRYNHLSEKQRYFQCFFWENSFQ